MSSKPRASPATKLYQEDVVRLNGDPNTYGIVLRCWHDAEDIPPSDDDPLTRPLERGEVGVTFLSMNGAREILPESDLTLIDRTLQPGDFCKRSIDDVRSGVVVDIAVRGKLEHAITNAPLDGWRDSDEVFPALEAEARDLVMYDDWIGQIIELYDENVIEVGSGDLVRFPEFGSRFAIGEKGPILPPSTGMQNFFGLLRGANAHDTVIDIKHTVYAVAWLAINQSLDPAEAQERTRPPRFWYRQDISKLTLLRSRPDFQMRVGDKVKLYDSTDAPVSVHGRPSPLNTFITVSTLSVTETETTVHVLWQDGTLETCLSVDLIPYLNTDEYDCWPGDHVIWRGEDTKRAAVVQTVDAQHRLASLYFPDTQTKEMVSVLEIDAHGTADADLHVGTDGLGVRIGDFVFVHAEGTTNGFVPPRIPKIGEVEDWVGDMPSLDQTLTGWHREMWNLGSEVAQQRGTSDNSEEGAMQQARGARIKVLWFGEVMRLNLDGTILVCHSDGSSQSYPLQRLTKLYDAFEQMEEAAWDDEHHHHHHNDNNNEMMMEMWPTDTLGLFSDGGWIDEADIAMGSNHSSPRPPSSIDMSMPDDLPPTESVPTVVVNDGGMDEEMNQDDEPDADTDDSDLPWKRFDILSSCPVDHAFYTSPVTQPSKSFLGRLRKEYRILLSSLPDNVIVRTYEDRTDLLRSLIIGPSNTPYEDAPFVIDWMLDSNFPNSPPLAHFLSWTNGNGRVNPNLYEEGKVCLSILGTWAGDQNEVWSAARSSLLQAFVSIQGLVLVKEPWFCEPAYEKLRGTEEGIVNSRLYSEKAYVLSRGFVRRALEIPLGGLEDEIKHLYYTNERLRKVVTDAAALIEKSQKPDTPEPSAEDEDLAVPKLTTGGILALGRTLTRLQALLDAAPAASPLV